VVYGLRDYGASTVTVWDGVADCEHEWGEDQPKGGRIKRPQDYDPKFAKGIASEETNPFKDKPSNFCVKCGAWRGSLGLEPDLQLYTAHLLQVFDECKRVLKKSGSLWINIGTSYASKDIFLVDVEYYD